MRGESEEKVERERDERTERTDREEREERIERTDRGERTERKEREKRRVWHLLDRVALLAVVRDGVEHGVEVEGGQVGVLSLDEHGHGVVVHRQRHLPGPAVVEVGEGDLVLGADVLADDDLVDVVELVPVLVVLQR
jgi:transcription termination factor Rho